MLFLIIRTQKYTFNRNVKIKFKDFLINSGDWFSRSEFYVNQ
ncbi:MAG: hypothetical protein K0S53_3094 [Bacteroidetes bacterium]|jgi:hypothetical protein|nr:hypothetical protein [Bacteroidota bacterium]